MRTHRARRPIAMAVSLATILTLMLTGASATPDAFETNPIRGARGFEQGINILPDGTIYIDEPSGLPGHSRLHRSRDGGVTFEALSFPSPWGRMPGGGDSDVVLSDDGRVYFLDLWAGSNSISVSKDGGDTWDHGSPFTTLPLSDRQWIAIGERNELLDADRVYAIYALIQEPGWAMFSRSEDGGLTWSYHRPVPFTTSGSTGSTGNLVADGDFLTFTYEQGRDLHVATSSDAGETWTDSVVSYYDAVDTNIPSIALDGEDIHASWVSGRDRSIKVATSHDRGLTWETPVTVGTNTSAVFTWVAARNGKVGVAWYSSEASGPSGDVPAWTTWDVSYVESTDAGTTYSDQVVAAPNVKTGVICTNGLGCSIGGSGGREVGDFIALEIGFDQASYITHYTSGGGAVTRQLRTL